MIKFIVWLWWKVVYFLRPFPKDANLPLAEIESYITMAHRTRWPWWKFKPIVWHNDDGNGWEIYFSDEGDYSECRTLKVDCCIGRDTGKIVGLYIPDKELEPKQDD